MDVTPLRPTAHLRHLTAQSPGLWAQVEWMRAQRGRGLPQWPEWCYLPLAGTVAILTAGVPQPDLAPLGMQIGIVGALTAWRATQGVYHFDPTMFDAVWATPLAGELPTALLERLPEWCCYVPVEPPRELFLGLPRLHGFFVHLEWDANTHHTELRYVLDLESGLLPLALHVQASGGLGGAFERTLDVSGDNLARAGAGAQATTLWDASPEIGRQLAPHLAPLVSLTLYLCSQAAEIHDATGRRPTRPQAQHTKRGPKFFAPSQPTTWAVAYRLGAALRRVQQVAQTQEPSTEAGRARPRAHLRRAHFHTYWTGKGRTTPQVRWLHPILVGAQEDIVPTIHPVE